MQLHNSVVTNVWVYFVNIYRVSYLDGVNYMLN